MIWLGIPVICALESLSLEYFAAKRPNLWPDPSLRLVQGYSTTRGEACRGAMTGRFLLLAEGTRRLVVRLTMICRILGSLLIFNRDLFRHQSGDKACLPSQVVEKSDRMEAPGLVTRGLVGLCAKQRLLR
jgi:hypothetical protein